MGLRTSLIIFSLAIAMQQARAAEPVPTPAPTPTATVIAENGQPVRVQWPDGREAVFKVTSADSDWFSSTFKVTDNDCSNRQNMVCRYGFKMRRLWVSLVWSKHPDRSRIDQTVEYSYSRYSDSFSKLEYEVFVTGLKPTGIPELDNGLPPHEIECEDFSWFPHGTIEAPDNVFVVRWESEDNVMNPETNLTENRSTSGVLGVEFKRVAPSRLRVERIDALAGLAENFQVLMSSAAGSVAVQGSDGDICLAGITTRIIPEIIGVFSSLEKRRSAHSSVAPFVTGSSGLFEYKPLQRQMMYLWNLFSPNSAAVIR